MLARSSALFVLSARSSSVPALSVATYGSGAVQQCTIFASSLGPHVGLREASQLACFAWIAVINPLTTVQNQCGLCRVIVVRQAWKKWSMASRHVVGPKQGMLQSFARLLPAQHPRRHPGQV